MAGVGLALAPSANDALQTWTPISERLLTARFHANHSFVMMIVIYAPTNDAAIATKMDFYDALENAVCSVHRRDLLLVLGDCNAESGDDRAGLANIIGPHGRTFTNENTGLFRDFCGGAGLKVAGSSFRRKDIHRWTWISHDGHTQKEIDHILVNRRWSRVITNCMVPKGLEFHTDHRAVVADVSVRLKASYHQINHPMKVDVSRLRDEDVAKSNAEGVTCFDWSVNYDSQDVERKWSAFKDAIQSAAAVAIGPPRRRRTEWISNATLKIVKK